jgi:16S rRNA (cytosine967-C5)-methyltransferase
MAGQKLKSARTVAMMALNQFNVVSKRNGVGTYAGPILNKLLEQTSEKPRATDLVFGTIRNQAAIDMVIAGLGDCPVERISAKLLNIIRIGAYELIYSPATADYSIVNEAVKNAKAIAGKKQTGFVNAMLRQIGRRIKNRQISLFEAGTQRTLPQTPSTGCEFDSDILPDPKVSPTNYLSTAFSLPKWLVNDWLSEFGREKAQQICFASNRRPSTYVRPNKLKTTAHEIAEKFRQANINFEISADESTIRIKSTRAVTELPGFVEGLFSIQDITASQAVRTLKPQPGWTILDLCAAPGGKTTQLAELTGDSAMIIATDINDERLEMVKDNIARLGINSVSVVAYENLERVTAQTSPFDAVLLDVPCSNTGVLAKRIEARYRIKPKTTTELTKTQKELLEAAAVMIKPQGKICYSTCSIQKAENSEVVSQFLQNHDFKLESELLILPSAEGFDHDGGYVAVVAYSI